MGCGPSQETVFQSVTRISQSPLPQHHQLYNLEKESNGVKDEKNSHRLEFGDMIHNK